MWILKKQAHNAERYPLFSKEAALCHAAKAARNDRKHTQNLESTFSMDSACGLESWIAARVLRLQNPNASSTILESRSGGENQAQTLESTFEKTRMDCHALPSGKDRNDRWGSALACNDEKNAISKKVDSSTATTLSLRGGGLPRNRYRACSQDGVSACVKKAFCAGVWALIFCRASSSFKVS